MYNNALALASIGCKEHVHDGFNPTFTIQGKLYHRMGNLLPERGEMPKFSQIYFHDSDIDTEVNYRLTHAELDRHIFARTSINVTLCNFVRQVFQDSHRVEQSDVKLVLYADKKPPQGRHARTYNLPASSEVAALLPGDATGNLDIILRCRAGDGQELWRISTYHRSYDPLHYVLLFPTGCDGWHLGLKKTDNKTLTAADFINPVFKFEIMISTLCSV